MKEQMKILKTKPKATRVVASFLVVSVLIFFVLGFVPLHQSKPAISLYGLYDKQEEQKFAEHVNIAIKTVQQPKSLVSVSIAEDGSVLLPNGQAIAPSRNFASKLVAQKPEDAVFQKEFVTRFFPALQSMPSLTLPLAQTKISYPVRNINTVQFGVAPVEEASKKPVISWLEEEPVRICGGQTTYTFSAAFTKAASALRVPKPLWGSAAIYRDVVEAYAKEYNISPALVLAIMRTESAFNSKATSHASALGLMQVVPTTAGGEVYRYLNGTAGIPTHSALYDPYINIRYGTTYLHLLGTRHFNGIQNSVSREYCMIAGYNAGPGAVYRAFDRNGSKTRALELINGMTSDEVRDHLISSMPAKETRNYVPTVLSHYYQYANNAN